MFRVSLISEQTNASGTATTITPFSSEKSLEDAIQKAKIKAYKDLENYRANKAKECTVAIVELAGDKSYLLMADGGQYV